MYCTECGQRADGTQDRCGACGSPLTTLSDRATGIVSAVAETHSRSPRPAPATLDASRAALVGTLVVTRGQPIGAVFQLTSGITSIGRHSASEIFLDDVSVSRRHAEIRRDLEGHSLVDLRSLNGSYLNGSRVDSAVLRDGDELRIGKFILVFVEPGQSMRHVPGGHAG